MSPSFSHTRLTTTERKAMASENRNLRVLMLPYLAYGHITAFFELAKKLSDRGFIIDLCSTSINLSFISNRITGTKYSSSIHLVELKLPHLPELPPHYHTTNGLPIHLKPTLFKALKMARPGFRQILKDKKPDILIHDMMLLWAGADASAVNQPSLKFYTVNAAVFAFFAHFYFKPGVEFPFPALYLLGHEQEQVVTDVVEDAEVEVDKDKIVESDRFVLVDSSRAIDAKYVDYLNEIGEAKIVPIGTRFQKQDNEDSDDEPEIVKWLGQKKEHSTVYVSFGSEYFLTKEEMEEVAYGLELSNVDFIWVIRFHKGEEAEAFKPEDVLPLGFLERIGEKGRVVEGWAPQTRILKHPSIGAFVTHCGWNSTLESIEYGVPIIAMPMLYDQPLNARMMAENGVAVEVPRDESGKLNRANIGENIRNVIFLEETQEKLRRGIQQLGENVRSRREEEMDGVVKVIQQLISESNNAST